MAFWGICSATGVTLEPGIKYTTENLYAGVRLAGAQVLFYFAGRLIWFMGKFQGQQNSMGLKVYCEKQSHQTIHIIQRRLLHLLYISLCGLILSCVCILLQSYVPTQDHDYQRRRVSARRAESAQKPGAYSKCPCCRDDQVRHFSYFGKKKVLSPESFTM